MNSTTIAGVNYYTLSSGELYQLLEGAVEMFVEYRDVHGRDEETAKVCAINEVVQGVDATIELQEMGELDRGGEA